ncbi:VOC family protein [Peribacillus sp. NPDC006672]|uniref:VOC family protein n=1 Tax=Peribacillus sp. NPDC006672 TaxID=3390606 RepID=UPI003D03841E
MKINHLNLTVNDVTASREFLEKYFGLTCAGSRGDGFAAMRDDDGSILTLMKGSDVQYPKTFHVGFIQENEEQVNRINQRLKDDGFMVKPPKHLHRYTFYVEAPGGFNVEVLC